MVAPVHIYVDVAGTDRSGYVLGVPKATRPLSDIGECDVILSNKGGRYATTFSEMQRVAVSSGRATFNGSSDYFTGTDGAEWSEPKWYDDGTGADSISGNTGKIANAAGQALRMFTDNAVTPSYTISVYVKTDTNTTQTIEVSGWSGGGVEYWEVRSSSVASNWEIRTRQGGVLASRATGGSFAVNTWYRIVVKVTSSTSSTVEVYNVDGSTNWLPAAQTHDSIDAHYAALSNQVASSNAYFDSFLVANGSCVADQLFEGVVDSIEFNTAPDTVTLHCVDDAAELEKEYDDTYGRDTGTFLPVGSTTDDMTAIISAVLSSGWTYTIPDCAVHDKMVFSTGTRRIQALSEIMDHTPYLGWYVLPMKHIVFVMPDTSPAPDAWTESLAIWADYGTNSRDQTSADSVDGDFCILVDQTAAAATTLGDMATIGVGVVDIEKYRFLTLYYAMGSYITPGTFKIKIDDAAGHYWTYTLPDTGSGITGDNFPHFTVRLPDGSGDHGWVPTNSPNIANDIRRFYIQCDVTGAGIASFGFDVIYFYAPKKLTSKYTVSNITGIQRLRRSDFYNRVVVKASGISNTVIDDATCQATYGIRELVIDDQSITTTLAATSLGRGILNAEGWDDTGDPVSVQVVNPGDMYNVMLGDTLTVTAANMNLSSATRTLISRVDSITEKGWTTVMGLSNDLLRDRLRQMWDLAKRKRY